jgi:1,2-diacylglycerol 3-alpha-glucosyltransferase
VRILITGSTYAPAFNGQSIFTTNIAEGLAKRRHEVWVVTPSDFGKPYQIDRNGVHIWTVYATELKFLHNQAYASFLPDREVKKIFGTFKPEIIHVQDHFPLSKCSLKFAHKYGVPAIGTNHFMPENLAPYVPVLPRMWPFFNRLLWWWMHRVFNHLDMATAPSRTAVDILKKQGLHVPLFPVSCGVNLERFYPDPSVRREEICQQFGIDPGRKTFLFVGRVDAEKRLDVLIRAIARIKRADIQFVITGSGAALHLYQTVAQELGVADQVLFTGFVPDVDLPLLLNSIDIFAMPSEAELLSIASLEAMASGRPLLAARSKALPELVTDNVNGYLFEPGNVDDAVRCMLQLANHPEDWARMGAASLARVQSHSIENVLNRYETLYSECITNFRK